MDNNRIVSKIVESFLAHDDDMFGAYYSTDSERRKQWMKKFYETVKKLIPDIDKVKEDGFWEEAAHLFIIGKSAEQSGRSIAQEYLEQNYQSGDMVARIAKKLLAFTFDGTLVVNHNGITGKVNYTMHSGSDVVIFKTDAATKNSPIHLRTRDYHWALTFTAEMDNEGVWRLKGKPNTSRVLSPSKEAPEEAEQDMVNGVLESWQELYSKESKKWNETW